MHSRASCRGRSLPGVCRREGGRSPPASQRWGLSHLQGLGDGAPGSGSENVITDRGEGCG